MENAYCYVFSYFAEAIILWQYTSNLFMPKRRSREKFIVLCALYFILFVISLSESKLLNAISYLFVNFIFLINQYRLKWHSALFHSAILTSVMGMCELMVYGIIIHFTPNFFAEEDYFSNLAIFSIFSKILFFTVTYFLIYILKNRPHYNQYSDKSIFLLGFIPLVSVFIMLTFVKIGENVTFSPSLDGMIVLSAVFLLIANLLVFGINQYNQRKNMEFTEMQLLLQKESDYVEYYKMLLLQNENQSILIHDIKKHLQTINLLNNKNENDKINSYIHQLMISSDLNEASRLCEHEMLNVILFRYKRQSKSKHITFQTDIRNGTTNFISDADITSLFCNLLDNAIEAAESVPQSFIEINIGRREKTPFVVITVINSCQKNPFSEQSSILPTNKSDKQNHGFGLKSIRKIVNKYHGDMQMYYHDGTQTFHTIITMRQ